MKRRSVILGAVLAVTCAASIATYFSNREEPAVAARTHPRQAGSPPVQAASQPQASGGIHVELERLSQQQQKESSDKPVANAFNAHSWYVAPPPPPPAPVPPPPVPTAPPLPFSYLGKYQDQTKLVVMLANGPKLYTVSRGEVIDGTYRVERITEEVVELVYLPLNITQSLSTAGAPEARQMPPGLAGRYGRP